MRTLLPLLAVLTIALQLLAAETKAPTLSKTNMSAVLKIGTADATNHYNEVMIVTGKVAQVTIRPTVTFLNLDRSFPNSPFTVVIFHGHSSFYGDANALRGKAIEIKGKIRNYHDKPEIALDSTNQITVLGVTNLELLLKPKIKSTSTNAPPATSSTNLPGIM